MPMFDPVVDTAVWMIAGCLVALYLTVRRRRKLFAPFSHNRTRG